MTSLRRRAGPGPRASAARSAPARRLAPILLPCLILALNLWLRIAYPDSLPVFGDEGINIFWAQEYAQQHDQGYPFLMDGRYLFGVLLAGAGIWGPAPLRFARLLVAILASVGCASAMGLGRQLGSRATALLAGLFYAVLPYAVFHERQALADPVMAAAGSLVIWTALISARRGAAGRAVIAGLAFAAAVLCKPSALVYGLAPALAVVTGTVAPGRHERWRRMWLGLLALAAAALAAGGFLAAQAPRLGVDADRLWQQSFGFLHCPPILCRLDPAEQWRDLQVVLPALPETLLLYFGWPALLLAGLAWPLGAAPDRRRSGFVFILTASILALLLLASRQHLVARYLTPLSAPLAALAAHGATGLAVRLGARPYRLAAAIPLGLVLAALWGKSLALVVRPHPAQVPAFDRQQYFTGDVAGGAFQAAARDIGAQDPAPFILTRHFMRYALAAYFDPTRSLILNPWDVSWQTAVDHLGQGRRLYLLDELPATAAPGAEAEWRYPYRDGQGLIRVRPVAHAGAQALAELYAFIYAAPNEIYGDYVALAAALTAADPVSATLVTYPSHQLALLDALLPTPPPAKPVDLGGATPWEAQSVIASLAALPAAERLEVVFLTETRLDPQRQVETWLTTHAFRLEEQWFGPLRWVRYARGPEALGQTILPGARFGELIDLERVDLLDPASRPGGVVRLRLAWRAVGPVGRAYTVFAHLFDAGGILAQRDGQPMGELRPTFTWAARETIVDQFAMEIPSDAAPGEYQLRVGLYDPETQARLAARLAGGASAEFWVGGVITIQP